MLKLLGIVLILDGAGSIGWYKSDLMSIREGAFRTGFRVLRTVIGICLVLAG